MPFKTWISFLFICFSLQIMAQIYDFTDPIRLPGQLNSSAEETNPILAPDGQTLYFVRTLDIKNVGGIYDQDIWVSRLDLGAWGSAKPIGGLLNNKFNNALVAVIKDSTESRLYLLSSYTSEKDVRKGIALSTLKDSVIGNPIKVAIPDLDIDGKYVSYFLSQNEDVLIFSYEGSDSEGEEDLYISTRSSEGWNSPEHMGNTINSSGFEISPFLCPSNDTLYFSSNGFKGEGDADIYYSVKKGKWTSWSKPVNLGKKINTPKFDAYLIKIGENIIWSSNRDGKDCDFYSAKSIAPPKLVISSIAKDVSEFQGYDGEIDVSITGGIPPFKITWSNGQVTEDLIGLTKGKYTITVIDASGQKASLLQEINEPIFEDKKIIRFPGVQYEFNSWKFINDSLVNSSDSLAYVAKLLQDYPAIVIELISHTDSRGEQAQNQVLSINRARACYIYLVEVLKVDPRRIVPVGKGELEPATWSNPTTGEKTVLTEEYINTFRGNSTLFEQLNQLNRRTEGRIIGKDFDPKTYPEASKEYFKFIKTPK